MSLEGTGGSIDMPPDVQEITEISGPETDGVHFPEPEFTELSEAGPENIEELLSVEENKAESLLQLAGDTIKTAGEATDPYLFVEEGDRLRRLENELKDISSETMVGTTYSEEDKANAIRFGNITFELPNESVHTITPEENKEDLKVVVDRVEIPVRDEEEREILEKATDVIAHNKIGTLTSAETQNIIVNLESIGTRELPGDKWYNIATDLLEKRASYDALQRPFIIRQGEGDDKIGEIAIIPTIKERFSEKDPGLTLKEIHDLEVGLERNPRAKLEEMTYKLKNYSGKENYNN